MKVALPTLAAELHFLLLNAVQDAAILAFCLISMHALPPTSGGRRLVGLYRVRINNWATNGDYPAATDKKMCGHVAHGSSSAQEINNTLPKLVKSPG